MKNSVMILCASFVVLTAVFASSVQAAMVPVQSATASSYHGAPGADRDNPINVVNGTGWDEIAQTILPGPIGAGSHWLTFRDINPADATFTMDFGSNVQVNELRIWNMAYQSEYNGRGVQAFSLLSAADDSGPLLACLDGNCDPATAAFSAISGVVLKDFGGSVITDLPFTPHSGAGTDVTPKDISATATFPTITARYIQFDINSNYGDDNDFVGLSEVTAHIPEPSSMFLTLTAAAIAFAGFRLRRRR